MPVLVIDPLEMVDIDHQADEELLDALCASQLLTQARLQIAPVMKARQKIGEAASNQSCAVYGVLDADRSDHAQVCEEISRQLAIEAHRIQAVEHEHAIELLIAPQRNQREAAGAGHPL